ncbi:MAG: hypothetical protein WCL54_04475 [Clostridia bacterium]
MKTIKFLIVCTSFLIIAGLAACSTGAPSVATQTAQPTGAQTINVAGWNFSVLESTINASLENFNTTYGYDGVSDVEKITKTPAAGKTFLLIKMKIEKKDGTTSVDWNDVTVKDASGNTFQRTDDSFLTQLDFQRIRGTTLTFGVFEGWIAFEINLDSLGLVFDYKASTIPLNINLK